MNKIWWGRSYCNNKVMKVKARDVVYTSTVVPRIVS